MEQITFMAGNNGFHAFLLKKKKKIISTLLFLAGQMSIYLKFFLYNTDL